MRKFSILCILLLVANLIFAQKVLITGIVLDESNKEPLLGATVRVKGSSDGTVTDFDGNFSLSVEKGSVLTVSFVGYVTKDVTLNANAASVRILLAPDNQLLEDVVIVGFGAQKKEHLTAAVSTISSDVLKNRPVQNVAQALMGVSPGLNISQDQGRLDKAPSINIRGRETIGEGSNGGPLILIDGMEGDMNTLNPQDIESISVLKDAAASSIYGSRAPFGVVLITTKSGSEGKVTLNYNNSFRWNTPVTLPKMADLMTNGYSALKIIRMVNLRLRCMLTLIQVIMPIRTGEGLMQMWTGIKPCFDKRVLLWSIRQVFQVEVRKHGFMLLSIIWIWMVC